LKLKKRGAVFSGTKKDQIRFVAALLRAAERETGILAMKPGWRKDGFILGRRMFGTAKGKHRWYSTAAALQEGEIGRHRGTLELWDRDVGQLALRSTLLTLGICVGLAAPLPSYVHHRRKKQLVSETAIINLSGVSAAAGSGVGKTTVGRAVAGLIGPPHLQAKWDFTRRGLEEAAEARNDLPFVLDDTEKHDESEGPLKTAVKRVTQIIPDGRSKIISVRADVPVLSWSTFGLSTSPGPIEELIGKRSNGERVRFIDVPVPAEAQGGIFDNLEDGADPVAAGKKLIQRLEKGVAQNYGLVFPLWIRHLLKHDMADHIFALVDEFVRLVAAEGSGWDARLARKFGVFYAAGCLAVEAGILHWPRGWVRKAIKRSYWRAVKAIRSEAELVAKSISRLAQLAADRDRFIAVPSGAKGRVALGANALGLRTRYKGQNVLAVRDEALRALCGSSNLAKALVKQLGAGGALVGGHGHARTTQLPIPVEIGGKRMDKPRFWLIDEAALNALAASAGASPV
jgi:hypothetical protein